MNARLKAVSIKADLCEEKIFAENQEIKSYLEKTIFIMSDSGGSTNYYDSTTGSKTGINKHHLRDIIYHQFSDELKNIDNLQKRQDEIIKNCYFRSVTLSKDYYRPLQPPVINDNGRHHPNLWKATNNQPVLPTVDIYPFLHFLRRMMGNKNANYFLDLIAYKLQNRDKCHLEKPHIACFFYNSKGGMGKSNVVKPVLEYVFGETAVSSVSKSDELSSGSSVDLWRREWLFVSDTNVKLNSDTYTMLKGYTGDSKTWSSPKHMQFADYEIPANLIMFGNSPPNFLEQEDRRFFISNFSSEWETAEAKEDYFVELIHWLKEDGGYNAINCYLLNRDISHFSLAQHAPDNEEKLQALEASSCPVVQEIKLAIASKPHKPYWATEEFQHLMIKFRVGESAMKYKMQKADLQVTARAKYKDSKNGEASQKITLWLRPDTHLAKRSGVPPVLRTSTTSRALYDHEDWKDFYNSVLKGNRLAHEDYEEDTQPKPIPVKRPEPEEVNEDGQILEIPF